jgi:hypothetical protein
MTFSQEQEDRIIAEAAAIVAERIWSGVQLRIDDVACVSIGRAAAIVDLDERQFRKILNHTVAFGARENKVRLSTLGDIVASRMVKSSVKGKARK